MGRSISQSFPLPSDHQVLDGSLPQPDRVRPNGSTEQMVDEHSPSLPAERRGSRRGKAPEREGHRIARAELALLRREAARRRGEPIEDEPASRPFEPPDWLVPPDVYPLDLNDGRIDPDAAKVARRLIRHGHEAYLVGGCVRDLLLGRAPKDFDLATSARPEEVRALFRNSRVIGRRFRLVHVLFGGGKIIETATFRRSPEPEQSSVQPQQPIRSDNAFGDAHEDASRRDFTINALFYDLEERRVLDWVGGMPDIERRTLRTIGDPVVRFLEDPVRMLRAIKFAARLDLGIAPHVYDAIVQCRGSLSMAARPRLFEELLRMLREGSAHRSIWLAWETGVLDVLLPEVAAYLSDAPDNDGMAWRVLTALDRVASQGNGVDDVVLCSALLLEPLREACAGAEDRVAAAVDFLEPVVERLAVPRRIADAVRRIAALLPKLEAGRAGRFVRTSVYPLATQVLSLSIRAREEPVDGGRAAVTPIRSRSHGKRRR
jgi:poly(A) polymerase